MNRQPSRSNPAAWLGPLISVFGLLSYFLLFLRWPTLRDGAYLNLALVVAGTALAAAGTWRTFRSGKSLLRRLGSAAGLLFSGFCAVLLFGYVFAISYQMPTPIDAPLAMAQAPDFALTGHDGETVRLSELRGQRVLLVFYRGYW